MSVSSTQSKTQRNAAGSRLANLYYYLNPKMLLRKDFYLSSLRGGAFTFLAILSILALYSIVAAASVANVVRYIQTRRSGKGAPTKPPGGFEINLKPAGKATEDGPDMDEVQEIPGEMELAELKDAMPADDLIPEIDSNDEAESVHGLFSDDDTTLVNREDFKGMKNTEAAPVPAVPHKDDVERPISPPATPPTRFATTVPMASVPQFSIPAFEAVEAMRPSADEEPTIMDNVVEKVTEITVKAVEEAAKAVEEHAKIIEEVNNASEPTVVEAPAPAVVEAPAPVVEELLAPAPEPHVGEVSPTSEFVVVPEHPSESEPEAPATKEELAQPVVESPKAPSVKLVEEPKAETLVAEPAVLSEEPAEEPIAPVAAAEPEPASALVAEPESLEAPAVVEEPKSIDAPAPTEAAKPIEEKAPSVKSTAPKRKDSLSSMNAPKSLGRPRVMRRATGSTAAVAGVTTSPASTAPIAIATLDDKGSGKDRAMRRADDALHMLAGSILRSNTSERLPSRPSSPAMVPRPSSPAPGARRSDSPSGVPRAGSPGLPPRSDSPSSEAAGSRPASPALGMSRRGSIALANGAKPNVARQSSLANVTNAPAPRQQSSLSNSTVAQSTFGRRATASANTQRGGSISPPPMPLPPQRQGSISRQPTVPQPAVMSPSVLSRKATIDSNGSPGSPPAPVRRPISPPPQSSSPRPPAEEFATTGSTARRRVPFPSASDGGQAPINASPSPTPAPGSRPRPRPRKSTNGGSSAPNTLQASLLANLGGPKPPSSSEAQTPANAAANSSAASPIRRDSFASAVSNRDSILSFSDRSDMDMSDLDFSGGEGDRMVVKFPSAPGAGGSDDEDGFSGNEGEKRKRRARRRSKARTLSLKKQKRGKRN